MKKTARNGKATARPSIKVVACTLAAAFVPVVIALLNVTWLEAAPLGEGVTSGITAALVFVAGYQTPPYDSDGTI
jgi:hypothetical protein